MYLQIVIIKVKTKIVYPDTYYLLIIRLKKLRIFEETNFDNIVIKTLNSARYNLTIVKKIIN